MSGYTVLFDACVLYPAPLRDFLMHLALSDLFRARWTNQIHEEWITNLLEKRSDLKRVQLERTRDLMNSHVEHCLISNYEELIDSLTLPDANDRHVLAAAIRAGADAIITFNLKDFPADILRNFEIEAQHPDEFIVHQIHLSSPKVCAAAKRQRESLQSPPKSASDFLHTLEACGLPQTVSMLQEYEQLI